MTTCSVQESLSVPLLGVEPDDNCFSDQQNLTKLTHNNTAATATATATTPPPAAAKTPPPPAVFQFTWLDSLIVWFISPTLLSLDFSIAFWLEPQRTQGLHPTMVYTSIVMFMLAAYLFRRTMEDMHVTRVMVILLPELAMDIVLTLVLFNQVVLPL